MDANCESASGLPAGSLQPAKKAGSRSAVRSAAVERARAPDAAQQVFSQQMAPLVFLVAHQMVVIELQIELDRFRRIAGQDARFDCGFFAESWTLAVDPQARVKAADLAQCIQRKTDVAAR